MQQLAIVAAMLVASCAGAYTDDAQYITSVKGGHHGGQQYGAGMRFYQNNTSAYGGYGGYGGYGSYNPSATAEREVGVCYKEVPTATLVRDPAHVPAGNGSRSDLSVIRTCCDGYVRNIHNFQVCDPVCSKECVNGLCTAPEMCTCFPDHVKNLAGFCTPTCPIGCQNGHCSGNQCMCKEGYRLHSDGKFCIPNCRGNCAGLGNCTAPDTCSCKSGYESTPDGSCRTNCGQCVNGDCVSPNECRCRTGYTKNPQGTCVPQCPQNCPTGRCSSPGICDTPNALLPTQNTNHGQPLNHSSLYPTLPTQHHYYPPSPGLSGDQNNRPTSSNQVINGQQPYQPGNTHYGQPNYPGQTHNPGNQGYHPININPYSSTATCTKTCVNAVCVEGNRCSCYPGYVLDSTDSTGSRCVQCRGNECSSSGQTYPSNPGSYGQYPVNPGQSYPGNPGQTYPGNPGQTYPGNPGQSYPGYPGQSNPGNPGQSYPGYPGQSYPGYPGNQGQTQTPVYPANQYSGTAKCTKTCVNSICVEGDRCSCNYGFTQDFSDPTGSRCVPQCSGRECSTSTQQPYQPGSGHIVQPLYPGQSSYAGGQERYPLSQNGTAYCSKTCINADCVEGNRCNCHHGYIPDVTDPTGARCVPHCPGGCTNGVCSAPNFCICNMGYVKDHSVKGRQGCVARLRRSANYNF